MNKLGDTVHRTPASACPSCGKILDASSGADHDNQPGPGDYTVCLYCAATLRFGDDLSLGAVSIDEVDPAVRERVADAARTVRRLSSRLNGQCPPGFYCLHDPKCPGAV